MKWSVGTLALVLPGIVGFVVDLLDRSPAINSREGTGIADFMFGTSVLVAVFLPAVFIMAARTTLARRLTFTGAVWCLVLLEVWAVFVWSLRGLH